MPSEIFFAETARGISRSVTALILSVNICLTLSETSDLFLALKLAKELKDPSELINLMILVSNNIIQIFPQKVGKK